VQTLKKQQVIQVLRNLANEIENGVVPIGVAIAWVIGQEDKSITSGHFLSLQHVHLQHRTLMRGEMTRLLPLDDAIQMTRSEPEMVGGGPTLMN
jgi:hypothetical protein